MAGVRNERQAVGEVTADKLDDHEHHGNYERPGQRGRRGPGMAVPVIMPVFVSIVVMRVAVAGMKMQAHLDSRLSQIAGNDHPPACRRPPARAGPLQPAARERRGRQNLHGSCTLGRETPEDFMKEFSCKDMGYDCDWRTQGDDETMMLDDIEKHGREHHGLVEFTKDMKDKVISKFHDLKEKVA
jgi:predicted small metal-binding protein